MHPLIHVLFEFLVLNIRFSAANSVYIEAETSKLLLSKSVDLEVDYPHCSHNQATKLKFKQLIKSHQREITKCFENPFKFKCTLLYTNIDYFYPKIIFMFTILPVNKVLEWSCSVNLMDQIITLDNPLQPTQHIMLSLHQIHPVPIDDLRPRLLIRLNMKHRKTNEKKMGLI